MKFCGHLQELLVTDLVTLCWAVKAQGQGQSLERVARCEQRRRSSGMQELSIRSSDNIQIYTHP